MDVVNGERSSEQWLCRSVNLYVNKVSGFCRSRNWWALKGDDAYISADVPGLGDSCPDINNCVCFEHKKTIKEDDV